jgi:hypothetical protein
MRQISNAALAQIVASEGTEPITLVQIFWDKDQSVIYGDRAFTPGIQGLLLDVGEINNVLNASEGTNTGSVSIRLDDKDGTLKSIMNTMDIHKRPVYILQWFPQIPLSDAFIVFDGIISSPIEWNEGERTLSFEVLNKIEDLEVGYSAEEGNFEYIPPSLVGRAWPLVFGNVFSLPCVQINETPSGASLDDVGTDGAGTGQGTLSNIANKEHKNLATLEELERECFLMAAILFTEADQLDATTVRSSANAAVGLHGGGTVDSSTGLSGSLSRHSDNPVAQQLYDLGNQYESKGNEYRAERLRPFNSGLTDTQKALQKNQIRISSGTKFPQKQRIIIRINGVAHEGYFEGDIFNIISSTSPFADQTAVAGPTEVVDRAVATEYRTDLAVSAFFYSIAGSLVGLGSSNNYPIWYVAGIPHLTNITVLGKKTTTGNTKYTIPASYYNIVYKTFDTLEATFIEMKVPLSSREGENWSDEIWINASSPIGPNAIDIMKYLIENYTNHTYDSVTFDAVRSLVNPYKCGFALTERSGTLQILGEIAYQSRCAIWFKGGRFYVKYLPKQYDPVDTITEDDIESGTLQVLGTDTEDVVTKWSIDWRDRLDREPPNKIIYRYHVKKYGVIAQEYNCYIYNVKPSVQKFALFWLIRKANTWKKIKFSTFINKLRLEPFDSVLLDFTYPWVNDPNCVNPTIGIVEEASYDSDSHRIQLTIWLPIRFGEMCPYDFAYPSDIDTTLIFPQDAGAETDVPGSGAGGQLYDQHPHTGPGGTPGATPPNSGSGGDTQPSDTGDGTNPAFNPPVALDPTELVNTAIPPAPVRTISQRIIKPLELQILDVPDAVFPGFIVGVEGDASSTSNNSYIVDVYFNGLSNPPKKINVKQLLIDDQDVIPPGTACIVLRNCQRSDSGLIQGIEYTIQVPVWLKPSNETGAPQSNTDRPTDSGASPPAPVTPPPETDEGDE